MRNLCTVTAALMLLSTPLAAHARESQETTAPAAATQSEDNTASRIPSAETVISSLDTLSPMNIVFIVGEYWKRGDKLKASFWYYIWQIRTNAWAGADSGFDQLRAIMGNEMGDTVNQWIAADPVLWREAAERASSYEAKLPLWRVHPETMSQEEWNAFVTTKRAEYATEMAEAFNSTSPDEVRAARTRAGLPVGPLTDMGTPLPEEWR